MSAIRVEGLSLDLVRDKQGKGNWENIGKPAQPQAPSAPSATPPAADGKGAQAQAPEQAPQNDSPRTPIKLDIDSLNVNNARVTYTDEASGKQYNVEGIELEHRRHSRRQQHSAETQRLPRHQPAGGAGQDRADRQPALRHRAQTLPTGRRQALRRGLGRAAARQDRHLLRPGPVAARPVGADRRVERPEAERQPVARPRRTEGPRKRTRTPSSAAACRSRR